MANYNGKFSQKTNGCSHSTIISPRDEIIESFDKIRKGKDERDEIKRGERRKAKFKAEVDSILSGLRFQPEPYYLHKASKDWCDESSSHIRNTKYKIIVVPRNKFKEITRIKEVVDDYLSSCFNCYVRGLEMPLASKGIEFFLRHEFLQCGGVDKWIWQQPKAQYWYDYWRKMWRVDVAA